MTAIVTDDVDSREAMIDCDHGTVSVLDTRRLWSEDQLVSFAEAALWACTNCSCFGSETWFPPEPPDHVTVSQLRLYHVDEPDPDIDTSRPAAIPPIAISAAANRWFDTRIPSRDHSLDADWRMVRWWWQMRQRHLLGDQVD